MKMVTGIIMMDMLGIGLILCYTIMPMMYIDNGYTPQLERVILVSVPMLIIFSVFVYWFDSQHY